MPAPPPHFIHIQSHSARRRCYSGVAMTHRQEGRKIKMSWSNSSEEEINQIPGNARIRRNHMTHSCYVNTVPSNSSVPSSLRGFTKKLPRRAPVSREKLDQSITQHVISICLGRKVGIIFWVQSVAVVTEYHCRWCKKMCRLIDWLKNGCSIPLVQRRSTTAGGAVEVDGLVNAQ